MKIISNTTFVCFQENVYINNIKNVNNIKIEYIKIDLMFLKVLMLLRQVRQKSIIFLY